MATTGVTGVTPGAQAGVTDIIPGVTGVTDVTPDVTPGVKAGLTPNVTTCDPTPKILTLLFEYTQFPLM